MPTKLVNLTPLNIDAIQQTQDEHNLSVTLTHTTATFAEEAAAVIAGLDRAINAWRHSAGHPRASLYAVRRKAQHRAAVPPVSRLDGCTCGAVAGAHRSDCQWSMR
jgi:hypothetical protein